MNGIPENYRYELVQKRGKRNFHPDFLHELEGKTDWQKVIESLNLRLRYPKVMKRVRGNTVRSQIVLKQGAAQPYICCPFHSESTPSLHFDFQVGFFYCFGCHAKGALFEFVMRYKNIDFNSAIDYVMRVCDIKLQKRFITGKRDDLVITEIEGLSHEHLDKELETYMLYCKNFVGDQLD